MILRLFTAVLCLSGFAGLPAATSSQPLFHDLSSTRQIAGAFTPQQIEAAYNFGPLTSQGVDGAGQTVALIEVDSFDPADVHQFDAAYGLPNPSIQQFFVGNPQFTPGTDGETAMDLEWAHALAPGAALQVYYLRNTASPKQGWTDLAAAVREALAHGATAISMSLGTCGASHGYKVAAKALAAAVRQGVSVFASSGDSGSRPGPRRDCGNHIGVEYPGDDPSVVSVGGTSLSLNGDNTISLEIAWRLSGGGRGRPLHRPTWQIASHLPVDRFRWAPDVAFLGDPATGVSIYFGGDWKQAGGTSLGAPAWAAIWSLAREDGQRAGRSVGAAPQLLYTIGNSSTYTQAFHDITVGDNGHYQAAVGWDAVTGWGTPNVAGLAAAIVALPATARRSELP